MTLETGSNTMNENIVRVHVLSRVAVAFVWIYHGLIPKLLGPHRDELYLASLHSIPDSYLPVLLKATGVFEIIFGFIVLLFWRSRWPFVVSIALLTFLLIDIAIIAPEYLRGAFNPVSLNVSVIALSIVGLMTIDHRH